MFQRSLSLAVFISAIAGMPALACGDDPFENSLSTDRPDIAESSLVLAPEQYQIEQGVTLTRSDADGGLRYTTPSLHRIGLLSGLEARLETEGATWDGKQVGLSDINLGLKWHFLDGGEWGELPSMALLAKSDWATALPASDIKGPDPSLKLLLDTTLPLDIGLGLNLGGGLTRNKDGVYEPSFVYALSLSHEIISQLRGYGEISGDSSSNPLVIDGGVTYLITPDLQLDAAVVRALVGNSLEWSGGVGISSRFY